MSTPNEQAVRLAIVATAILRPIVDTISLGRYLLLLPFHLVLAVRCLCTKSLRAQGRTLLVGSLRCTAGHFIAITMGLLSVVPVTVIGVFSLLAHEVGLFSASLAMALALIIPVLLALDLGLATPDLFAVIGVATIVTASLLYVTMAFLAVSDEGDE